MLNSITIMGRLVRDPELRRTASGIACTSASIAVDRDYAGKGAEKKTDFFDVVAWRSNAEFFAKYFKKGRMVVVKGRLETRTWVDKQGNNRKAVEIIVDDNCIYFCDDKKPGAEPAAPAAPAPSSDYAIMDDDDSGAVLPF